MTRSVRDTATMLDAVEGPDPGWYGTAPRPQTPYSQVIQRDPPKLRIAYMTRTPYGEEYENPECVRAVKDAVGLLESLGHTCIEDYPPLDIHYHEARILIQSVGTNAWIERIARGSGLPVNEKTLEPLVYKAYLEAKGVTAEAYVSARNELTKVMRDVGRFMEGYDILVSPTMGILPLQAGIYNPFSRPNMSVHDWVLERRRWSGNTAMCNVTGQPSITVPLEQSESGLPLQFVYRSIMDQDNFPAAVEAAAMSRVATCNNLMVCSTEGEMVCLEMEYKSYAMLYMKDGIISHANHYKHPHMPRAPYRQMDIYPQDELRSFRLDYLAEHLQGNALGVQDIMNILSDHEVNYPASVCQHLPHCATNFSTVNDLDTKEMHVAVGNPCGGYITVHPFEE